MILYPEVYLYKDNSIRFKGIKLFDGDREIKTMYERSTTSSTHTDCVVIKRVIRKWRGNIHQMENQLRYSVTSHDDVFCYASTSDTIYYLSYVAASSTYSLFTLFKELDAGLYENKSVRHTEEFLSILNSHQLDFPFFIGKVK